MHDGYPLATDLATWYEGCNRCCRACLALLLTSEVHPLDLVGDVSDSVHLWFTWVGAIRHTVMLLA